MKRASADTLARMRSAAKLLPDPGPVVVVELLDEIDRLRAALREIAHYSVFEGNAARVADLALSALRDDDEETR